MRLITFFILLALLVGGAMAAQTKINSTSQINWTPGIGAKLTNVTNGTAAQDGVTYSQLMATASVATTIDSMITKDGSTYRWRNSAGNVILSSSNATEVFNWATANNSSILVGIGTFILPWSISIVNKDVKIIGLSKRYSILSASGSCPAVINAVNTDYVNTQSIQNICISGNSQTADGIRAKYVAQTSFLVDVNFTQCNKALNIINYFIANNIYGTIAKGNNYGIYYLGDLYMYANTFIGGELALNDVNAIYLANAANGNRFSYMVIEYNGDDTTRNVKIDQTSAVPPQGNVFSNIWFEDNTNLIWFDGTGQWTGPYGNVVRESYFALTAASKEAFRVSGGRNNFFEMNYIPSGSSDGSIVVDTEVVYTTIIGNRNDRAGGKFTISDSGTSTITTPNYYT